MVDEKKKEEGEEKMVELKESDYKTLLDTIAEADERLAKLEGKGKKSEDKDDIDELLDEGKGGREKEERQVDLDGMSNTELVRTLEQSLKENMAMPIMTKLYQMDYYMQILELKAQKGYEDFDEHKDAIRDILIEHPKMNVQKAYKMAKFEASEKKAEKGEKGGKGSEKESKSFSSRVKHITERDVHGEKPGLSQSSARMKKEVSLDDAVSQAAEEIFG